MRIYRVQIIADKYPCEYNVQASNWGTAISRAIREWSKEKGKGSRTEELRIKAIKSGALLTAEQQ